MIKTVLVVAVAENGVIGADGGLPWHLPSDLALFKSKTMGRPIIMGRKTFESIGKALPGRTNIVVSSQPGFQPEGVIVINELDLALDHARQIAAADGVKEIMVIGGATIYEQAMPAADQLYVTHVHGEPGGDAYLALIDEFIWQCVEEEFTEGEDDDTHSFTVKTYERV